MIIFDNGMTLKNINARLREREIGPAEMIKPAIWGNTMARPYAGKTKFKGKTLKLSIEFKGSNQLQIELNKSAAALLLDGRFIRFTDMQGWRFYCLLNGEPSISDTIEGRYQTLNYSITGYFETAEIMTAYPVNGIIYASEVYGETPATIEVSGADSVTVNLGADTFIINSIGAGVVKIGDGKALKNGVNHWQNVTLNHWPRVTAETPITFTPAGATVKVTYRGQMI